MIPRSDHGGLVSSPREAGADVLLLKMGLSGSDWKGADVGGEVSCRAEPCSRRIHYAEVRDTL
jgi:hypothetical protein